MTQEHAVSQSVGASTDGPLRVHFVCTGVGIMNRGIETFFRECFDGLRTRDDLDLTLYRGGAGPDRCDELQLWTLPRTGRMSEFVARLVNRSPYVVEQLLFLIPYMFELRRTKPHVVFFSDMNLAMQLYRLRPYLGGSFKMVYSNGAPLEPPYTYADHVQQVTPVYYEKALEAGEPASKHSLVPYGIQVPECDPNRDPEFKKRLRRKLDLPVDSPLLITVGWISAYHKRMDYVIQEVASLPEPRPHLLMLGAMDDERTPPILAQAREQLGPDGFTARSVPYEEVADYYRAADAFTLGSLREGFGRVYLEALIHGLPCVVHNGPIMQYVMGDQGHKVDLSQSGMLSSALRKILKIPDTFELQAGRRESVRRRFSWEALAPQYRDMFYRSYCQPERPSNPGSL